MGSAATEGVAWTEAVALATAATAGGESAAASSTLLMLFAALRTLAAELESQPRDLPHQAQGFLVRLRPTLDATAAAALARGADLRPHGAGPGFPADLVAAAGALEALGAAEVRGVLTPAIDRSRSAGLADAAAFLDEADGTLPGLLRIPPLRRALGCVLLAVAAALAVAPEPGH
jgi:hypothetical protein